ncbi:hypothetical protein ACQKPX_00715 [Photobacterium sp. DNB23_23_1]|uniref:Uncharacterized protein n=1 Tax=Photobacterium pectinilyticum TaxID=2906793 RepID=A0ABT1N6V6_9GAMM|nr:hypothetical protein [Photobacterium sp. ZSDE20]MCQ1060488.1 hypothetical protein [Photobacterium sp. ZSDE20]MDD1827888.1 hypothetical protein [Photobacterium sp. ZSDE20]
MVLTLLGVVCGLLTLLAIKERGQFRKLFGVSALITSFITSFFLFEHLQEERRLRALTPSAPQFAFETYAPDEFLNTEGDHFSLEDLEAIASELVRQLQESENHIHSLQQRLDSKRQFILDNWDDELPDELNISSESLR